jgi:hypothetical protein
MKTWILFISSMICNYYSAQITTYSGSYGITGINLDQPELQLNLETTYEANERFTQLYRWRLPFGNYKGLLFEYNNRFYFGKNRDYDNSKWFFQAKVGYGFLKGRNFPAGTVYWNDPINNQLVVNTEDLADKTHVNLVCGLAAGYKLVLFDHVTLDISVGYAGFTTPNFGRINPNGSEVRKTEWKEGIGYPVELGWSLGFFL